MRRLVFYGDDLVEVELPPGTEVVEAPPPLPPLPDYREAVRRALNDPVGSPSLRELVGRSSRVLIAFDDPCLPLPPPLVDPRRAAIETLLQELYSLGVQRENVRLVCAVGLHRKWTARELRRLVGRKVWAELGSSRIVNHDAEDPSGTADLGTTPQGNPVEINRGVMESDLAVYVNVNWTSMNGGWKSYMVGLGTYRSIRAHHNPSVLVEGGSVMDPSSRFHAVLRDQGRYLSRHAVLLSLETVLNNRIWPGPLAARLSLSRDEVPLPFRLSRRLPQRIKSLLSSLLRSAYAPVAVHAGHPEEVHDRTLQALLPQQDTRIPRQVDAMFLALPNISPYAAFSRINPLLAANAALGYVFNLHLGRPAVRKGGVLILMQPFLPGFHPRHHLPYIEFYEKVLAETTDPREMEIRFEESFADRREYIDAYRFRHSYHGVHPFYVWYWCGLALRHLERVIVVGAVDPSVTDRLGFDSASSLEEAWKMAEETLGKDFSLLHPSLPPIFSVSVSGDG
jgi:hypothetical protein